MEKVKEEALFFAEEKSAYLMEKFDADNALIASVLNMSLALTANKCKDGPFLYARARLLTKYLYVSDYRNKRFSALSDAAGKISFEFFSAAVAKKGELLRDVFVNNPGTVKRKRLVKFLSALWSSSEGHDFFNKLNCDFFEYFDSKAPVTTDEEKKFYDGYLSSKGFEGAFPFYRRRRFSYGEFVTLCPLDEGGVSLYLGYAGLSGKSERSFRGVPFERMTADDCEWNARPFRDARRIYLFDIKTTAAAPELIDAALEVFRGKITQIKSVDNTLLASFANKGFLAPVALGLSLVAIIGIPLYYLIIHIYFLTLGSDAPKLKPEYSTWSTLLAATLVLLGIAFFLFLSSPKTLCAIKPRKKRRKSSGK